MKTAREEGHASPDSEGLEPRARERSLGLWLELPAHVLALALAAWMLLLATRPLYTDDLWWHLSLGEAYLSQGPWLAADPVLHGAPGPPNPASWLSDAALFALADALSLDALRVLHGLSIIGILALVWLALQRASASRLVASVGTGAFVVLAAYRLFQLRPELATVVATLALYPLLLEPRSRVSRGRVALVAALCLVWSNLHAGFLLGPLWIAIGALGLALGGFAGPRSVRPLDRRRASRLAAAAALALLATLVNPGGLSAHLAYLRAGHSTPELVNIADEWRPFSPWRLPNMDLPPSPFAWGLACTLLVATPVAALVAGRRRRRAPSASPRDEPDGALVGLSLASLLAALVAVRFLWLYVFPLLLLARMSRGVRVPARTAPALAALLALGLLIGFGRIGDGQRLALGLNRETYRQSYEVRKYYVHAAWFLRDTDVQGDLYNAYYMGGFLGFWLAPKLCAFINGSLNVREPVIETYRAIQRGAAPRGAAVGAGTDVAALLERHGVDLFVGVGLPYTQAPTRPQRYTTSVLERAPGWTLVFRNLRSAVYLRRSEHNRDNLLRIRDYYARSSVPFDPERGFETERVIREAPRWAEQHGLRIRGYSELLEAVAQSPRGPNRARLQAQNLLAAFYAAVGEYRRAITLDRRSLALGVESPETRRRLLWSLLRLDRVEEAQALASRMEASAARFSLTGSLVRSTAHYASLPPGPERDALVAMQPVFTRAQAAALARRQVAPEIRPLASRASRREGPGIRCGD